MLADFTQITQVSLTEMKDRCKTCNVQQHEMYGMSYAKNFKMTGIVVPVRSLWWEKQSCIPNSVLLSLQSWDHVYFVKAIESTDDTDSTRDVFFSQLHMIKWQ